MGCYCDSDMPKLYVTKYPKSRKTHRCCECSRPIKRGDVYEYVSGLWDCFQTFKTCEKCSDLRSAVDDVMCVTFGELYDAYEYIVGAQTADRVFGIVKN